MSPFFGNKDDEMKKVGEDMAKLSEQIGALQQQLNAKTKEADSLRTQAAQNAGASAELKDAQAQIEVLRNQLADMKKQQQASAAAPAAAPAPQQSTGTKVGGVSLGTSSTAGGLAVGASAWVTRAGGLPLRLRSGPGLDERILDRLQPGTQMTLQEGPSQSDGHAWWRIRTSDGREGWVAGEDLRTQPD
jgi:hypothetical protein